MREIHGILELWIVDGDELVEPLHRDIMRKTKQEIYDEFVDILKQWCKTD